MPLEGSNSGLELLIDLRRGPRSSGLSAQIESALRDAVRTGRLRPGDRLPPSRTLADDLGVSRRVVVEAFGQLAAEGWLEARVGAGTYVRLPTPARCGRPPLPPVSSSTAPAADRPARAVDDPGRSARFDFFPGHPELAAFPRRDWARLTREALQELPDARLGYGDPRGLRELRVELAKMLARTRGVVCRPRQVIVCQGVVQALGLLAQALGHRIGAPPRIAIEDPYLPEHRDVLGYHDAELVPIPVDELGVRDRPITSGRYDAVLLTPAHQNPTGVILSPGRRAVLARWAQERAGLLVEDDYDAEYRYNRAPIAALQALAPQDVVYLGSASKTLAPGLRLAWIVAPEDQLDGLVEAKRFADGGSPVIGQATFARLLSSGRYDRHIRASRRRQAARRQTLIAAACAYLPEARIDGAAAGLHAILRFSEPLPVPDLYAATRRHTVRVYPLSDFYADPPTDTTALVIGYGALAPDAIRDGIRRLALAVADLT